MSGATYTTDRQRGLVVEHAEDNIIILTEDKVRVRLMEYQARRDAKDAWIAPLSVFVTLIAALAASTFNRTLFGIPASVWEAGFWLGSAGTFVWLAIAGVRAVLQRTTLDRLIEQLKSDTAKARPK